MLALEALPSVFGMSELFLESLGVERFFDRENIEIDRSYE